VLLVSNTPIVLGDGEHVYSILLGFDDQSGTRRFNVHAYVRSDRTIAASGLLDPKFFLDDAMCAHKSTG
jgi:hypothetical protein